MPQLLKPSLVECTLCPKACRLAPDQRGDCRVRYNAGGRLLTLSYGKACSVHLDPVEKKPMFHFLPGSGAFSLATAGCNLHCLFCQNWEISQADPEELDNQDLPPARVVELALRSRAASIAYTYSDPVVFYEYTEDTATLARARGVRNILVTAGFINPEPLRRLCRVTDGVNLDIKGFTERFYREVCGGSLAPVLEAARIFRKEGVVLEITNLVVPTLNDDPGMIRDLCRFVARDLGREVPLHFSRFYPMYRMRDLPPTPAGTLLRAREIALEEGLAHVYIGNLPDNPAQDTSCAGCGAALIRRSGFAVLENRLAAGACPRCGKKLYGLF